MADCLLLSQSHVGDLARPHLCRTAWHRPWPVWKRFSRDHDWWERIKPGWRTAGSITVCNWPQKPTASLFSSAQLCHQVSCLTKLGVGRQAEEVDVWTYQHKQTSLDGLQGSKALWPDDLHIQTWPVFPGDTPDVQITSYFKAFESYRLTDRQTDRQTRPKLYAKLLHGWPIKHLMKWLYPLLCKNSRWKFSLWST